MEDNDEQTNEPVVAGETATETTEATQPEVVEEAYSPDDATLERAVKAGLSLAEARSFTSKDFAESILGKLEGGADKTKTAPQGEGGDGVPSVDFTGFGEAEGYDPQLVRAMQSLKSVIEAQQKTIAKLSAGSTAKAKSAVAEVRKNLTLARPGGAEGTRRQGPASAESDILAELRNKYKLD